MAALALGLSFVSSSCYIHYAEPRGEGAEVRTSSASVPVAFTRTGQTTAAVESYASLSSPTYGAAILATDADREDAVRRALFPAIARGQPLDIAFVVDTTASMAWALDSVKAELHSVVTTLAATNPDTRYAVVAFRDRGNAFVSQLRLSLDGDPRTVHAAIDALRPDGRGDNPEHVYAGVRHAIRNAGTWRPNAGHHVVLVGDAPAHEDYQEPGFTRANVIAEARDRQIRIHTVAIVCALVCRQELGAI